MVKVLTVKIRPVHVIEKQVELSRLRLHDTVQGDAHLGRWFVGGQVLATNRWNFGENFGVSVLQEKVRQVRFSIEVRLSFFLLMSDVACCYTFRSSLFGGFFCQSTREEFFGVFFRCCVEKRDFDRICFVLQKFLVSTRLKKIITRTSGWRRRTTASAKTGRRKTILEKNRILSEFVFYHKQRKNSPLSLSWKKEREKKSPMDRVFLQEILKNHFSSNSLRCFFSKVQFLKNGWTGSTFALLMPKGD